MFAGQISMPGRPTRFAAANHRYHWHPRLRQAGNQQPPALPVLDDPVVRHLAAGQRLGAIPNQRHGVVLLGTAAGGRGVDAGGIQLDVGVGVSPDGDGQGALGQGLQRRMGGGVSMRKVCGKYAVSMR